MIITTLLHTALLGAAAAIGSPNDSVMRPAPITLAIDSSAKHEIATKGSTSSRELSTDRPDATESPYTVPRGRIQIEASFAEFSRTREEGTLRGQLSLLPTNFKFGVLDNFDLQFIVTPFLHQLAHRDAPAESEPFCDITVRAKLNLLGNDSGRVAFGLMPFARFPKRSATLTNSHVEGGLILPFAVSDLPAGFDLGAMAELDVNRNATDSGYGLEVLHTLTLGHSLFHPQLGYFVEYAGIAAPTTGRSYEAQLDFGTTYGLHPDLQFDAGMNLRLSRTGDLGVFLGVAVRL